MRKSIFILFLLGAIFHSTQSQEKTKSGFGFGALPAISFDSDLGFQYGALVNLYHYGDGTRYPKYNHSLYMEYSRYTKGTGINRLMYDSDKLIHGIRTTFDMTYLTDQMADFYGFNGYQSVYDAELSSSSRYYNKFERNMFRIKADFQSAFADSPLGWVAGYSLYNFNINNVNLDKLSLTPIPDGSLYEKYVDSGLIGADEAKGGRIQYVKAGLKYDTRDQIANPKKGVWTELVLQSALPGLNDMPHAKLALIHRQYFNLARDLTFAYRLDYQGTIGNSKIPFYAQPLIITSFLTGASYQGMGGKNSIRGVLRNRVVGDGIAFGNFEFRYKFVRFDMLKQQFYVATNVFLDAGTIVDPIELSNQNGLLSSADKQILGLTGDDTGKIHTSAGLGLKIGWNENFVVSADWGKAFNEQDGNSGFYIGLNYLF